MSFARYFKLSSYFMIASGFAAIAATGALDLLSLGLFSAALLASWFVDTERLQRRVPGWLLNCLAVAYLPLYVLDHAILSHSYVISTIHLVFYVAALKLLTLSRDRDYFYLYLISFAELLVASTLTIDLVFKSTTCTALMPSETQAVCGPLRTMLFGPDVAADPVDPTNPVTWPTNS